MYRHESSPQPAKKHALPPAQAADVGQADSSGSIDFGQATESMQVEMGDALDEQRMDLSLSAADVSLGPEARRGSQNGLASMYFQQETLLENTHHDDNVRDISSFHAWSNNRFRDASAPDEPEEDQPIPMSNVEEISLEGSRSRVDFTFDENDFDQHAHQPVQEQQEGSIDPLERILAMVKATTEPVHNEHADDNLFSPAQHQAFTAQLSSVEQTNNGWVDRRLSSITEETSAHQISTLADTSLHRALPMPLLVPPARTTVSGPITSTPAKNSNIARFAHNLKSTLTRVDSAYSSPFIMATSENQPAKKSTQTTQILNKPLDQVSNTSLPLKDDTVGVQSICLVSEPYLPPLEQLTPLLQVAALPAEPSTMTSTTTVKPRSLDTSARSSLSKATIKQLELERQNVGDNSHSPQGFARMAKDASPKIDTSKKRIVSTSDQGHDPLVDQTLAQSKLDLMFKHLEELALSAADESEHRPRHRHSTDNDLILSSNQALFIAATSKISLLELETTRSLDLNNISTLESLGGLEELAPELRTCTVNGNCLRYLDGIPRNVTKLSAAANRLTNMTSFAALTNLQYLDISDNAISDLIGLSCCIHLRELVADKNGIASLNALPAIPGLLKLSLRNNTIIDFDTTRLNLACLEWLDVSGNKVVRIDSLSALPCLETLILDRNVISCFELSTPALRLRHVSLNDNRLQDFDVETLPLLTTLHLDDNNIRTLRLPKETELDCVSLRHQRCMSTDRSTQIDRKAAGRHTQSLHIERLRRLKSVALSGNAFSSLDCFVDYYQLETLELARCGIRRLPDNLHVYTPCLRHVNLNHNSLTDLTALRGLSRLRDLEIAGNDIADFFELEKTLTDMQLTHLDLRHTPLTALFYSNYLSEHDSGSNAQSWLEQDTQYAKSLNDTIFVKRHCYRTSLLYQLSATLEVLDGIHILPAERERVNRAYARMQKKLSRVFARPTTSQVSTKHSQFHYDVKLPAVPELELYRNSPGPDPHHNSPRSNVLRGPLRMVDTQLQLTDLQHTPEMVPSTRTQLVMTRDSTLSSALYDDLTSQTAIMTEMMHILGSPASAHVGRSSMLATPTPAPTL